MGGKKDEEAEEKKRENEWGENVERAGPQFASPFPIVIDREAPLVAS